MGAGGEGAQVPHACQHDPFPRADLSPQKYGRRTAEHANPPTSASKCLNIPLKRSMSSGPQCISSVARSRVRNALTTWMGRGAARACL